MPPLIEKINFKFDDKYNNLYKLVSIVSKSVSNRKGFNCIKQHVSVNQYDSLKLFVLTVLNLFRRAYLQKWLAF